MGTFGMESVGARYSVDDTIVAIASAAGGAARGLVRLSGPRAALTAASLLDLRGTPNAPRGGDADLPAADLPAADLPAAGLVGAEPRLRPVRLRLPGFCAPLPVDWYYWPFGRSYTGQEVVELHTIGSPPLLDALIRALCSAGARLAQPGEFTLRAFLSGRIDLTQAEAVLGVIDAGNRRQWEAAVRQLAGGLSRPLGSLRAGLLDLLADVEAGLDFADEDLHFITRGEIEGRLSAAIEAASAIGRQLETRRSGDDRLRAVLVGPPNAGKSSLFNALLQRAAALVADEAGTTRDYLTASLDCGGIVWELIDTPGVAFFGPGGNRVSGSLCAGPIADEMVHPRPTAAETMAAETIGPEQSAVEQSAAEWSGAGPIASEPPVFGECERKSSGISARAIASEPQAAEPTPPAELGPAFRHEALSAGAAGADLDELVTATAMRCIEQADLMVICLPLDGSVDESIAAAWTAPWRAINSSNNSSSDSSGLPGGACRGPGRCLMVGTKCDLCGLPGGPTFRDCTGEPVERSTPGPRDGPTVGSRVGPQVAVSSRTGRGLAELCELLHRIGDELRAGQGDAVASTALRCAESIDQMRTGLAETLAACRRGEGDELLAERLRGVLDALGRIVGAVYTEELLGNIFSRFCIGK